MLKASGFGEIPTNADKLWEKGRENFHGPFLTARKEDLFTPVFFPYAVWYNKKSVGIHPRNLFSS